MYAKLRINIFWIAIVLLLLATTSTVHAQVTATPEQSIPGTATTPGGPGSGTGTATIVLPGTCPGGAASCPGTPLCVGGTVNEGVDSGKACTATASGDLARDGVFGCSASKYQNIGTLTALQGVYVPVNDAAVTINTGYLVYKECVLDGVVAAIRNDAVSGLQSQTIRAVETGRNGGPQYVRNEQAELAAQDRILVVRSLSAANTGSLCPSFQTSVRTTKARSYMLATSGLGTDYACTMPAAAGAGGSYWSTLAAYREPQNNPYGAYLILDSVINRTLAYNEANQRERWQRSGGFYDTLDSYDNPLGANITTPGFVIAGSLMKMLGAGTDILINANEIDQVNGALQAGLQSSIVSDTIRGLAGFVRSQNGQASYIDRMSAEASLGVRSSAINAAIGILGAARQVETIYKNAKESVAQALIASITRLRDAENTCWGLIVPKVQEQAQSQGVSLVIATTTAASQQVITSQIQSVITVTDRDLRASEAALRLINELIIGVTNTSSAAAQRSALTRLDSMVANNQLHSADEASTADRQKDEVKTALETLITDTLKEWGDSTDPNIGWCNVKNPATIDRWMNAWRQ